MVSKTLNGDLVGVALMCALIGCENADLGFDLTAFDDEDILHLLPLLRDHLPVALENSTLVEIPYRRLIREDQRADTPLLLQK